MVDSFKALSFLGIGSVPFEKGVNACEEIFESWDLPFWPQYPSRSPRENFIFQFLSFFPGLRVGKEETSFDEAAYLRQAREYRTRLQQAFSEENFLSFEPPRGWALGFSEMKTLLQKGAFPEKKIVKLQVTGPGTVWNSFFSGRVSSQVLEISQDLCQSLAAAGLAQIERISSCGRRAVILIDEPVRAKDLSGLRAMVAQFRESKAGVGLHVCSSTDWEGLERLGLDLFHFDLTTRSKLSPANRRFLQTFLKQRKWVAWGVVSTRRERDERVEDASSFFWDILRTISDEELTIDEIAQRSLIAPGCGTGTLTPGQDEAIRESLHVTSESLKRKLGVHLA